MFRKSPYEAAYQEAMVRIAQEVAALPEPEPVAFLFDESTELVNLRKMYKDIRESNPECGKWMASINSMSDKDSPAIQGADMFAALCKDVFLETLTKRESKPSNLEMSSGQWHHGGISYWNKNFMSMVVDASVLKHGKPSIYSTVQRSLFDESLVIKETGKLSP